MRLIAPELIAGSVDAPRLCGNRCSSCDEPYFPAAQGCTRCGGTDLQDCDLGDRGRLWSWTLQMFRPKPPYDGSEGADGFRPYGVGYVELDCGLKVESRLLDDGTGFAIGMPMRLVLEPYRCEHDGAMTQTFAFAAVPRS